MKAKYLLILWILVPLFAYLVIAPVFLGEILLYEAEKRGETVSPINLVLSSWAGAWFFIFILMHPAFGSVGFVWVALVVIFAYAWVKVLFGLYGRHLEEISEEDRF